LAKAIQNEGINMNFAKQSRLFDARALLEVSKILDSPPPPKILRPISARNLVVQDELGKARKAWEKYQSTRRRNAIYDYLSEVLTTVRRWKKQDRLNTNVDQALKAAGHRNTIRHREPFSVVVFCTSDADTKTRSKWSRALTFAQRTMPDAESLAKFMQRLGGINECADRFPSRE
jgi:hypothetical protein